MPAIIRLCLLFAFVFLAGCAADGTVVNPFVSTEPAEPGGNVYYAAFADVPIPVDMNEQSADSFVSLAPHGGKTGVQTFHGRIEAQNLVNTMRTNMTAAGWVMRSMVRAKDSLLVYEKKNQICSILIMDGRIYTSMRIFIASRLDGDTGGPGVYAAPMQSAPAPKTSGTAQKLSQ